MIVRFEYGLHGDDGAEQLKEEITSSSSPRFMPDDDLLEKIGRPFYEVILFCALDTETGAVTVEGATIR